MIDKIYKASSSDSGFEEDRRLNYDPPKELENKKNAVTSNFEVKLSSLNDCNGVVYMFKQGVELKDIKTLISYTKDQTTGIEKYDELRKLEPTNVSVYSHVNTTVITEDNANWGSGSRKEDNDDDFLPSSKPTTPATGNETQFNLTSGTIVDGWIIYMTSSASSLDATGNITLANVQTITGDVVKTEKVAITTIGNKILSIDNVFQVPFDASTKQVKYCGNSTRFASEPLNSEQYQVKYGDTVGERGIPIVSQKIYSLKRCVGETGTVDIPDY